MASAIEVGRPAVDRASTTVVRLLAGDVTIDPWGCDPAMADLVRTVAGITLRVDVLGPGTVPSDGPCVVVTNQRFGMAEPFVAIKAVHQATGRRARFLGLPEVPFLETLWRRSGAATDRPEEMAGLLRAGEIVVLLLGNERRHRHRAGALGPERLRPALDLDVPVVPMALAGNELTGRWRAHVGDHVRRPPGYSPLSLFDLAAAAQADVQHLLDEAFPPRWLLG
jgi:hypothetical protein